MSIHNGIDLHFSQTYAQARQKFLAAADRAGLPVQKLLHPCAGRDGEMLSTDVVRDGPSNTHSLLVISSACHGVEGFCGSGVQVEMLHDDEWRRFAHDSGVAVLYVHALNPYGFSWWRRTTQENVDLNRNFVDFNAPLPRNVAYDEIASLVVSSAWPPSEAVSAAIDRYVREHGQAAFQSAVTGGQYHHPDGLFYGGRKPSWSHTTAWQIFSAHASSVRFLAWIDIHTGLGPSGHGERIFGGRHEAAALQRARSWWGEKLTVLDDGSSASSPLTGTLWQMPHEVCPQAQYTSIGLEFGTVSLDRMIDALRADQWLHLNPDAGCEARASIKQQIRDAFYTDTPTWKRQIVEQAKECAMQAVRGLAGEQQRLRNVAEKP